MKENEQWRCDFCEVKSQDTSMLIAGPKDVAICDRCIGFCANILAEKMLRISRVLEMYRFRREQKSD